MAVRSLGSILRAFLLASLLCAPQAVAQQTTVQRFAVGDRGHLQLNVPAEWLVIVRQATRPGAANTIVFTPKTGVQFELSVTPSSQPAAGSAQDAGKSVRASVERLVEEVRPNVVENDLPLARLQGVSASGFYFSATDKAPKPNDYRHLTQGMLNVARVNVAFTLLTHDGQDAVMTRTIAMLKSATFVPFGK